MAEKVSYVKEAFKEPLNIWGMVVSVAAAVYASTVGHAELSWMALGGGAALETLYLATLPATSAYRRVVARRARSRELADRSRRREALIREFDPREREAVEYLRWLKNQIYSNYKKFTHMDEVPDQIKSLEGAWDSFVDFLDTYRRLKNHVRSVNRQMIQNQINQAERAMQTAPDETTAALYEKNLEFLNKRLKTANDIERSLKRVEAQLQSIESFFALVNDQVITMPTPEHISSLDFESLLSSIELTKEILEQTAPVFNSFDLADRTPIEPVRPPVAQRQ